MNDKLKVELAKFFFDLAKIILASVVLGVFLKDSGIATHRIQVVTAGLIFTFVFIFVAVYLIYKQKYGSPFSL